MPGNNNVESSSAGLEKVISIAGLSVAALIVGPVVIKNALSGESEPGDHVAPDPPQAEAPFDPTEAAPSPTTSTEDTPPEAVEEVEVDSGEWGSVTLPGGTPTSAESAQGIVLAAMESADVPVLRESTRGERVSTADQAWRVMEQRFEEFAEVRNDVERGPAAVACSYFVRVPSSVLEQVTTVELTTQINESFMRGDLQRAASFCGSAVAQGTNALDGNELLRLDKLNHGCDRWLFRAKECR